MIESESYKNFLKGFKLTSSAAVVNVILQLIFTPIIARIFPPESYGIAAIYGSIFSFASVIIPLGYPNALMLPDNTKKFFALCKLILFLTLIGILFLSIPIIFFYPELSDFFELNSNLSVLFIIPAALLVFQLANLFELYHLRKGSFKTISIANVTSNLSSRISTLVYGFLIAPSGLGMVIGRVTISVSKMLYLSFGIVKEFFTNLNTVDKKSMLEIAIQYKNYPTKILPSTMLNTVAPQISVWMLLFFFSTKEVGLYSFAIGLLGIPLSVMTEALRPVFFQKAVELYRKDEIIELNYLTTKIFKNLSRLAALPLGIIAVFSSEIFDWIFGNEWALSGTIASYFAITFFLRGISVPFSSIRNIKAKEGRIFSVNISLVLLKALVFLYAYFNKVFLQVLLFEAVLMGVFYLINCVDILKMIVKKPYHLIAESLLYILGGIICLWILKNLFFLNFL